MSCNNCSSDCTKVKCIPSCVCEITIGEISSTDTPIYVFIKNLILERIERFDAVSDNTGLVVLNLCPSPYHFTKYLIPDQNFELWIEKQDTVDGTHELITIDAEADIECINFEVGNQSGINEWTLSIE